MARSKRVKPSKPSKINMFSFLSFLDLPGEIRNLIYRYALVLEGPITTNFRPSELALNLLRANKQIHDEARSILHSQNTFNFFHLLTYLPLSFLQRIGPENAKWIESLEINFPEMCRSCGLELDSVPTCILEKLQSDCPNLKRLTLGPFIPSDDDDDDIFAESTACTPDTHLKILELIAPRLRAISPQLEITFKINDYCDCLTEGDFKTKLDDYGWKVCVYVPESWTLFEWSSLYRDSSDDKDVKSDGAHEVDDDSDFWRRPADLRAEARSRRWIRKKS